MLSSATEKVNFEFQWIREKSFFWFNYTECSTLCLLIYTNTRWIQRMPDKIRVTRSPRASNLGQWSVWLCRWWLQILKITKFLIIFQGPKRQIRLSLFRMQLFREQFGRSRSIKLTILSSYSTRKEQESRRLSWGETRQTEMSKSHATLCAIFRISKVFGTL